MEKKKIKFIACIIILVITILEICFMIQKSVVRSGESEIIQSQNVTNAGKINSRVLISQSFEAAEPFQGVAFLMGTFGEKQHGILQVKIIEQQTGKTVFNKSYNTSTFEDNKYFCFASEQEIDVHEPTMYEVLITGKLVQPGLGTTIWCSEDDLYEKGILKINGEEQSGDLCFGIVHDYKETMGWGIFARRCEIILLIAFFLVLHCFIDIKKLYEFVYQNRVWLAIALFIFCVANKFNGSSVSQYDNYIQPGEGSEYVSPLFGTSRSIRSDEWLVSVPRSLSAEYTDYGKMNDIVRATETTNLSASGLYLNYSALAKPADWGYYLFGSEYGISFVWSFRMIFGFLFSFELCMIISKKKKLLSIMGGAVIWFSSFNMWWSTVTWLIAGQAAIVFFYYFVREKRLAKRLFFGAGIAISAANFVVDLYPAWQVPAGYVYLALLIWIIIDNRDCLKNYRIKDWILAGGFFVFMISIIGMYLYNYMDYVTAIMNTVYPGGRTYYGGFSIDKLCGYLISLTTPYTDFANPSEMGCFYGLFPFSVIVFAYALIQKKGKNLLMWCLLIPAVIMGFYCIIPLPHTIAKLTLLTFSMPKRVVDVLGYLNVLMLVAALSELREVKRMKLPVGIIFAGISTGMAFIYAYGYCDRKIKLAFLMIITLLTFILEICLVSDVNWQKKNASQAVIAGIAVITGLSVNPLTCGLDAIYSKPVAKEIKKIVENNPKAKWIGVDSIITPDYLIACGARTYNSTNYIPNMEFWEKLDPLKKNEEVYNRYAHICITLTEEETEAELVNTDYIQLDLNYEDLSKFDVDYILSVDELESADENGLQNVYSEYGMYIYKISEKNY